MKTIGNTSTNDYIDNRLGISNRQDSVPGSKFSFGSVEDKYPVILDGGRTIIFISNKNKESITRKKYELRLSKRFAKHVKKPKL